MSLPILIGIVAVGIALTVLAVHFTGGSKRALIRGPEHAEQLFRADHPEERPAGAALTSDFQSAFMSLPDRRLGVVHSFGDGYLTRIVSSGDVARLRFSEPSTVSIRFKDFTWSGGSFSFLVPGDAQRVFAALGGVPATNGKT